jgi:hypothetical protein
MATLLNANFNLMKFKISQYHTSVIKYDISTFKLISK